MNTEHLFLRNVPSTKKNFSIEIHLYIDLSTFLGKKSVFLVVDDWYMMELLTQLGQSNFSSQIKDEGLGMTSVN